MAAKVWRSTRSAKVGVAIVAVLAVGTGTAVVAYAAGNSAGRSATSSGSSVSTAGFPTGKGNPGIFTDRCTYSHEAADDPILAPGKTGQAMHHDFFGNTGTNASSTSATLRGKATTCTTPADASAYWTPVLYQNGKALTPRSALIYWRSRTAEPSSIQTIPQGLSIIAGNENATTPQQTSVIRWTCQMAPRKGTKGDGAKGKKGADGKSANTGGASDSAKRTGSADGQGTTRLGRKALNKGPSAVPHNCATGTDLKLTVTFPSCWDGHTLDGAKQTNVAYPAKNGTCSSKYPVHIPQIVFHVAYPTASAAGITLSMTPTMQGSPDTEHVDFINGWDPTILAADVKACVATSTRCGPVSGANATPQGPSKAALAQQARQQKMRAMRQGRKAMTGTPGARNRSGMAKSMPTPSTPIA